MPCVSWDSFIPHALMPYQSRHHRYASRQLPPTWTQLGETKKKSISEIFIQLKKSHAPTQVRIALRFGQNFPHEITRGAVAHDVPHPTKITLILLYCHN